MNLQSDDFKLRELFQAQRRQEAEKVSAIDSLVNVRLAVKSGGDGAPPSNQTGTAKSVFSNRLALAASIMVCVGVGLAARLWFVSTQTEPSTAEWAALTEWSPITDTLLESTPLSITDTTFITDDWFLDEMYTETHNQQEVL